MGWEWNYEVNELAKELGKYVKFPEVAYLEIETRVKGKKATLKITDFQLAPTAEIAEIAMPIFDRLAMTGKRVVLEKLNYYIGTIKATPSTTSGRVSG